ncbi:uncharacterized protein LOC123537042 [Mercenaria mercenaria]|uniref:uncharacterized protein LOC123537042 n=1 Tax=Mercenaria mercenaria TaxID=6596 RepID=UPI00234F9DE7|nr:uncharacterized protein LOC123537042 [Mercenaria mercenaria]
MSEDLLRQAELRHQRRPRSRQNEEILPVDVSKHKNSNLLIGDRLPVDGSCLPPIRHFGNYDKSAGGNIASHATTDTHEKLGGSNQLSPVDRPRTPRRRIASHTDRLDVATEDINKDNCSILLPFIKCKMNDKNVKALINTVSKRSTISHRLLDGVWSKNDSLSKAIEISGQELQLNLSIDDAALHDLVFGMDFIYENHCMLDFSAKVLKLKGGLTTQFLAEGDIPLKFRSRQGLASSI